MHITRKQYLDNAGSDGNHRAYYAQFVTDDIKRLLLGRISEREIRESTDDSLNDIYLGRWDRLVPLLSYDVATALREHGDYLTLGGGVCVLKEAARQIQETGA